MVISQLEERGKIKVQLSADDVPLTDEQLSEVRMTVDGGGLTCRSAPLYGESAFEVWIVSDSRARPGHYTLKFEAEALDQVGRTIFAEDSKMWS